VCLAVCVCVCATTPCFSFILFSENDDDEAGKLFNVATAAAANLAGERVEQGVRLVWVLLLLMVEWVVCVSTWRTDFARQCLLVLASFARKAKEEKEARRGRRRRR